jgi:hypothetical protein
MRKVLAGTIGCVVMAAMLTACGGGGGSGDSSSGKKDEEFSALFEKSKTATARVTYENRGDSGTATDTYTVSQRGDGTKAFMNKDSKWVVKDGKAFTCDSIDTPEANCDEVPGGPDAVTALVNGFAAGYAGFIGFWAQSASAIGFSKKTTDTIAGRSAECREITIGGGTSGIAKKILNATGIGGLGWAACLDKDTGVALRFNALGGKTKAETVAVKFEDPKDSDFETPTSTTTTEGDTSDTTDTTDTTEPDSSSTTTEDNGSTTTTECTPMTLPSGITLPNGNTLPCAPAING